MTIEKLKQRICIIAAGNGWTHLKIQEWCLNFSKTINEEKAVLNIYWNKRTEYILAVGRPALLVVQSAINHPKKGRTQLHRRGIDLIALEKLFENPRTHTGKGYYSSN